MMNSGIPTASGYEERIRFSEMEVVDRGAQENGLIANTPHGHFINGWDVNVAGVRVHTTKKRFNRKDTEGEYIIRIKAGESPEHYVVRRYEDFKDMHDRLRVELAGKVLPPLPKKNSTDYVMPSFMDDASSLMSGSSDDTLAQEKKKLSSSRSGSNHGAMPSSDSASSLFYDAQETTEDPGKLKPSGMRERVKKRMHKRHGSSASAIASSSPRGSVDMGSPPVLFREAQRVSLRAALRTLLQNQHIARSTSMQEFLMKDKVELSAEEVVDIDRRRAIDEKRIEEQTKFYEIAQRRAAEVDVHMERFRRDIIESSKFIVEGKTGGTRIMLTETDGLRNLFASIKQKNAIAELPLEHKKVAEWLRIE